MIFGDESFRPKTLRLKESMKELEYVQYFSQRSGQAQTAVRKAKSLTEKFV